MLTYDLQKGNRPLYEQLYFAIRHDIERKHLAAGKRLPSKRLLAKHLNVSVITVEGAYDQLVAEGYVRAEPRRGYFVCSFEQVAPAEKRASEAYSEADDSLVCETDEVLTQPDISFDLSGAQSPSGLFPYAAWARTMRAVLSEETESTLQKAAHPRGAYELRSAIAAHLRGLRGMDVSPDQIVVGAGAQLLYALIVQLLGRERIFAIENPGYRRLLQIYRANDVRCVPVMLDDAGPVPDELLRNEASVLHCMPSHQFPTGITTPVGRRQELLAWAAKKSSVNGANRYLIEDDFDCEFRMTGRPIPALMSMDAHNTVIYTNTFTKTLGATFRIGYMVLPKDLSQKFAENLGFYSCTVGALEQLTLARFMLSGEYERHINRQRTHFRRVQNGFVRALDATEASPFIKMHHVGAGLHFVLEVAESQAGVSAYKGENDPAVYEQALYDAALKRGLKLAPLSEFWLADRCTQSSPLSNNPQFMINVTSLTEDDTRNVAQLLSDAICEICMA
ncbi:PLP-dependent aminotransferase family protein [Eggerthellaceae bacterium 3-80]|nr:PLP-dependent aminotransferase family protein [bacterium D16-34]